MVAMHEIYVEPGNIASEFEYATVRMKRLLAQFEPISLAEMEKHALLDRTDTKYIMQVNRLYQALQGIIEHYRVLDIDHIRLNRYQTLYFDTPDFELYRQHHNGLRSRYKVRVREYVDSELTFWEVKRKTNQERTVKSRLQMPGVTPDIEKLVDEFIDTHSPLQAQELEPKLWNRFLRITLVSQHNSERLTLDLNLEFGWGGVSVTLPGIAVAEVKRARSSQHSDFIQQMRQMGIRPNQFSKYCAGVYMLYDNVKINNFKPQIRLVDKLIQKEVAHEYIR